MIVMAIGSRHRLSQPNSITAYITLTFLLWFIDMHGWHTIARFETTELALRLVFASSVLDVVIRPIYTDILRPISADDPLFDFLTR